MQTPTALPVTSRSAAVTTPAPAPAAPSPVAPPRDANGRRTDAGSPHGRTASPIEARPIAVAMPGTHVVAKAKYPRALARRALLLPLGVFQGTAMFTLENVSTGKSDWRNRAFVDPRLRVGIGFGELELGGSVLAYEPTELPGRAAESERLLTTFAAAKLKILRNTAIGGELAVRNPVADARIYAPRAIAATKISSSATSAVEVALKAGADLLPDTQRTFVASGELRLQGQVSGQVAVEARALVAYLRPSAGQAGAEMVQSSIAQTYGIRIVGGISHELDVILGADVTLAEDRDTVKLFSLGFAARRLP